VVESGTKQKQQATGLEKERAARSRLWEYLERSGHVDRRRAVPVQRDAERQGPAPADGRRCRAHHKPERRAA